MKFANSLACLSMCLGVTACVSINYIPPEASTPVQYERTVAKSYDEAWTAFVAYASGTYFVIDHFEKASGLMTLTFGSSQPAQFVDCGIVNGHNFAQGLQDNLGATLDGKMNVFLRRIDASHTLVSVHARYIFTVPQRQDQPARTWTFDSGKEATLVLPGGYLGPQSRTCRPSYLAERQILDSVTKLQ